MSDAPNIEPTLHAAAALLPWYAAGTLEGPDAQEVEQHLAGCAACRTELDEVRRLRVGMKEAFARAPKPSPDLLARIQRQLPRPVPIEPRDDQPVVGWFAPFWWRPWLPAALAAVIVTQFAAMAWLAWTRSPAIPPAVDQIQSRSIPPATTRLKVSFTEGATEQQIRTLLREIHGRIADGPLVGDFYVIEVPGTGAPAVDRTLEHLRAATQLVRAAERAHP